MVNFSHLKQSINLAEYASALGYTLDTSKSTKASMVMRYENSDKVVISRPNDIWIYFSVYDDQDNGTILDFVKNRSQKPLYEIGKELELWKGASSIIPNPSVPDLNESSIDPRRIKRLFTGCTFQGDHAYLVGRGFSASILESPRFRGRVLQDQFRNVVFPHFKQGQVCGLELKSDFINLFVRGSEKTFWRSNHFKNDDKLLIAESPIDAMSYDVIHQVNDGFYLASGGSISNRQKSFIHQIMKQNPELASVIIITDNDQGGDRLTDQLEEILNETSFAGTLKRDSPKQRGDDWNDVLQEMLSI